MQLVGSQRVRAVGLPPPLPETRRPHTNSCATCSASSRGALVRAGPWLLLVFALACLPRPAVARGADEPHETAAVVLPRVRTFDLHLALLIRKGYDLSPTLKQLVNAVERSDLIVHIERHNRFRDGEAGRLRIAGEAGGQRYLQISLSTYLTDRELVVFLAHELQHAVEVAQARDVVDEQGLRLLYCQIGTRRQYGFDTSAAWRVTQIVTEELARSSER